MAYQQHLIPWLVRCTEKAAQHPPLRESHVQYHELIAELTGQNMYATHRDTLADTLLLSDNLLAAQDIR
ncbi:hypothetical protein MHM84_20290 [Halomonas sp. McH1-25]|uniref:hypothetical protein n=1 Tax=unclassified Halomonas TaxID=2609666 RepID=UPI001EF450E0|nr:MULTISPECIES: hypothetical protein [unclassified Halomonas]MCG7602085.1 hypothetical protein [Halomonas sp. McH1-25]MCP1343001.1 hypothetical protein [Halomonas sp. FL8]MCP1362543.1 hypothetical protein [Halomonas sp. BBD45]MCP1364197.1 hypothetical protein [Halomonas sp. BBD48]